MNSSVFITGGSGLLALNWAITERNAIDITLGVHERQINLYGTNVAPVNLESVSDIKKSLEDCKSTWVIHTAGLTSVEQCELNPEFARHVNVTLAQNVAIACAQLKIPLTHISTDHLFSGDQTFVNENSLIAPINVYGKTKAEAELQVLEANPEALVIRTNFYGWGTSYRQSFSDMVLNALRANQRISLFRDVYYTPILAEVLVQLVHQLVRRGANGVFNLAGDDRLSKYDFGIRLAKEFGLDSSLIDADQIANRPLLVQRPCDMSLSNLKVTNFLGVAVGGVGEHLLCLKQQEVNGLAQELKKL